MRYCKICGKPFEASGRSGRKEYCSDDCRKQGMKAYDKLYYQRIKHKIRIPDHEIICTRCGQKFMGRNKQMYCPDCLRSGDSYMSKIRGQRRKWV